MADTVTSKGSYTAEKCKQKDSPENMIGIRSIMIEQETLFKEQVQALHRLYKVQKLEMQDFKNKKTHLTFKTAELTDGFSSISQLEDKSGALVRPVARVYKPATGSLSLHPFCSLKLFEGSRSASFLGTFQQQLDGSQSKKVKNFDLERFPESYPTSEEESEIGCVEEYKSGMSIDVSEDGLITTTSSKIVSSETEGNQDSSLANPMDTKAKLFHQDSFASVNGCLNSSSSEGEQNTVTKVEFPKTPSPPSRTQCGSSESHSKFIPRSGGMKTWSLKTIDMRAEEHDSEELHYSELTSGAAHHESSNPRKRRRRDDTIDTEDGMDGKVMK